MARKKPGSSSKSTTKSKAARPQRTASKGAAQSAARHTKTGSAKASSSRGAPTGKNARSAPTKKSKLVKNPPAAKSKSPAKESKRAKAATAAPSTKLNAKAAPAKPAAKTAKGAKATKAGSAPTPSAGKGASGKKGASQPTGPVPDAQGYVVINGRRVRMISTKGLPAAKRAPVDHSSAKDLNDNLPKKPRKSRLSPKDLEEFRELLLLRRRQLAGDLTSMESEALRSSGGNVSHMPIHMADIGTDTFDQDFMLGLAANERGLLKEIDDALERIEKGEYGICALTGEPIPKARLHAKPWAKYTVEAARMIERGLNTA